MHPVSVTQRVRLYLLLDIRSSSFIYVIFLPFRVPSPSCPLRIHMINIINLFFGTGSIICTVFSINVAQKRKAQTLIKIMFRRDEFIWMVWAIFGVKLGIELTNTIFRPRIIFKRNLSKVLEI